MLSMTSSSNPRLKQARALRRRKEREATGLFLAEGIFHVGEAVAAGAAMEYICYAPDLLTSDFARELIGQQSAKGIPCYATAPQTFSSLTGKENPQGILAVVRQRPTALEELNPQIFNWGVALVAPQDPGNVGAILRTIDAVGASGLLLLEGGVDPYHPTAVRASMGALFWHPVVRAGFSEFAQWVGQYGYHVYGTSARGSADYSTVSEYKRPLILLVGSEREGLSVSHAALCDHLIRLPMRGHVTSLNLAVAAGVMLYAMEEKLQGK